MKDNIERAISHRLRQFSDAYSAKNLAGALNSFSKSVNELVVIGSADSDLVMGLDAIKNEFSREFAEWDTLQFELQWACLAIHGNTAWVPLMCELKKHSGGAEINITGRLTAVLIREQDDWFIAHLHFSFPYNPFPTQANDRANVSAIDRLRKFPSNGKLVAI